MEIEKSKVLIQFLLIFRQSGDVLFFLNVRRLRGHTATMADQQNHGKVHISNFCNSDHIGFERKPLKTSKTVLFLKLCGL